MSEIDISASLPTLVNEARDLLADMETGLLDLERDGWDDDAVNAVFRAVHTIKGSAGLFGLNHIVRFTHVTENVLQGVRDRSIGVDNELIGLLLECQDHLSGLIEDLLDGPQGEPPDVAQRGAELAVRLSAYLDEPLGPEATKQLAASASEPRSLLLSLRFGVDSFRCGFDPVAFLNYLGAQSEITHTVAIPLWNESDTFDPEACNIAFLVRIDTALPDAGILETFEFVMDDGDIRLLPCTLSPDAHEELVVSYAGANAAGKVEAALAALGVAVVEVEADVAVPVERRKQPRQNTEANSVRVEAERLDQLIETVGELVIATAGAALRASESGDASLMHALEAVTRHVEEVRGDALRLRMVPIDVTFKRFHRVVRDLGAQLGKNIALEITGGESEVDKALVDQVADPLTHLVRNSLDHGIETAEERLAAGKPEQAKLRLNAFHDSGTIVIEVIDDGGGIDTERVYAKAKANGLIEDSAQLTEQEICELIFEPGFSTAENVSDISGRGVGMDVVKKNIAALRGTVEIDSRRGAGATVRIRLPLTLAIIDGFLVEVGGTTLVIPLDRVLECVELPRNSMHSDHIALRGEVLPLYHLSHLLGTTDATNDRHSVVVVTSGDVKAGLVVDALRGEFQTVIKPLGELFRRVEGIGGSTILGDGTVALIIDVATLLRYRIERAKTSA